jgi:NAD(P)-dependent dehydrogenase (short-subunit alcohol dehydrogenase family)
MIFCKPEIEHKEQPNLIGKSVLIVGGTHGIGEAVARKCITEGAEVTVIGRTKNLNLDCKQVLGDIVEGITNVEQHFVGKDYVFNNIGIYEKNTIVDTSRERLQKVLLTNVEIMYVLAQYSIKHALEVVVNMSSRPILDKYHSWSLYTLSKQAVITITQASAEEGNQKHYAICPSRVDTKFRESVFPGEDKLTRLTPEETADIIITLFNGKNPTGSHYWIKRI